MRDSRRTPGRASLLALLVVVLCSSALYACGSGPASGQPGVLTLALAEDPDPLDPTTSGTFVSRIVYVDMCEKLYDVGPKLQIVPQLATALPTVSKDRLTLTIPLKQGVRFNDGTPFDAQAVKTTFEHYLTYKESSRAGDLAPVKSIEVVDPHTVRLHLKAPSAPLLSLLADRAGMILSPTQLKKLGGAKFATNPVCVGAFKYTDRVAGDHITLDKSPYYYDRDKVRLKRIIFKIITDGPVRASNLRSGDVDVAERLEPFDVVSIKGDSSIHLQTTTSLGYQGITINSGNTDGTGKPFHPGKVKTPLGEHPELREAFEAALDRNVINKVVFYNQVTPDCGPISPVSPWFDKGLTCAGRNLAKARALVAKSGVKTPIPVKLLLEASSAERAPRAGHPGDGARGGLRGQGRAERVHDGPRPRRPGRLRRVPGRLVGPHRPRRQPLQPAAERGLAELRRRGEPDGGQRARGGPRRRATRPSAARSTSG